MAETCADSVPIQETASTDNPRVYFDVEIGGEPGTAL